MSRWLIKPVVFLLGIACSVALVGCSDNDRNERSSSINGNVGQVTVALDSGEGRPSEGRLASIKEFFSLVRLAHAQALGLEDITVEAVSDGQVVDRTQTDATGDFSLTVLPGTITLNFEVDGVVIHLEVFVPEKTVVTLGVSLDVPEEVAEVEQLDYVVQDAIRCTSEDVTIADGGTLEIEGDGGACISVAGNCSVDINAESLRLSGCERCIAAAGSGNVSVTVREGIECSATESGLWARGNATVSMTALGTEASADDDGPVPPPVGLNVEAGDEANEPEEGGEIEIEAPVAVDLAGNPEVSMTAASIEFVSANNVVETTGNSVLSIQALRLENLVNHTPLVKTNVEDVDLEDGEEDDDGIIHLSSTSGSALVSQGSADVRLVADRKVLLTALESAVDTGGSSSVEIGAGTGSGDGVENLTEGDVDIRSDNAFGVAASGSSNVFIAANGECTVVGGRGDVADSTGTVSVCK
jgi:hypothetical protein